MYQCVETESSSDQFSALIFNFWLYNGQLRAVRENSSILLLLRSVFSCFHGCSRIFGCECKSISLLWNILVYLGIYFVNETDFVSWIFFSIRTNIGTSSIHPTIETGCYICNCSGNGHRRRVDGLDRSSTGGSGAYNIGRIARIQMSLVSCCNMVGRLTCTLQYGICPLLILALMHT